MTTTDYTDTDAAWDGPLAESDDAHLDVTLAHPDDEDGDACSPAEAAAAEALRLFLVREGFSPAEIPAERYAAAAFDLAAAVEGHHQVAAYEEAAEAMEQAEALEAREPSVSAQRNRFGLRLAAKILRDQAAALRADLAGGAQ